jgi:hypothetical protein
MNVADHEITNYELRITNCLTDVMNHEAGIANCMTDNGK